MVVVIIGLIRFSDKVCCSCLVFFDNRVNIIKKLGRFIDFFYIRRFGVFFLSSHFPVLYFSIQVLFLPFVHCLILD